MPDNRPHPAFLLSAALGAVGAVLLVTAAVTGNRALFVAGFVAGASSLGAALYWRAELISAWREQQQRPRPPR